jgi:5-methylcytosine-specific restriction protein A
MEKPPQTGRRFRDKRYDTTRWRWMRREGLKREPFCCECGKLGKLEVATVRDHIVPVSLGGDFWSESNHQSLCDHHHNVKSAKESRMGTGVASIQTLDY